MAIQAISRPAANFRGVAASSTLAIAKPAEVAQSFARASRVNEGRLLSICKLFPPVLNEGLGPSLSIRDVVAMSRALNMHPYELC